MRNYRRRVFTPQVLAASDKLAADEKQYFKKILNGKYEEADIIGSLKKALQLSRKTLWSKGRSPDQ